MIIQRWLVFATDVSDSYIKWHLSRNRDVVGYMKGIPPSLEDLAEKEGWSLPHIWEEILPTEEL